MRVPGSLKRDKLQRGRRPHPAYYRGRRVHVAYYRRYIPRRSTPLGVASGWQDRFGSTLDKVSRNCVTEFVTLDPMGTWGGLYDYQVPYMPPMWVKWARKWEDEAANAGTAAR